MCFCFFVVQIVYEIVYEQFFTTVCDAKRNNDGNDPDGLLADFQTVAINAIRNVLLPIDISGCFFHLSSNLWKHIQRARLQECYMDAPQFGSQLRMIAVLASVFLQDMVYYFDEFCVVIQNQYNGDADEVLDYFEDIYIGRFCGNAPQRPALFPIELWNMFNRATEEFARKNLNMEACHSNFQANVSSTHPTFWKFLDVLLREEGIVQVRIFKNQTGHAPEP